MYNYVKSDGNISNIEYDLNDKMPKSGGTFTGNVNVNSKVYLLADNEGGNIQIHSPNGHFWEMDAIGNSELRLFHHDGTDYKGFHYWSDSYFQSAGDVITSSGVSLNDLSTSKADVETYVSNFSANIASDSRNQITAHGTIVKKSNNLCDIHLQIAFITMGHRSSTDYYPISKSALCSMFGVNSLKWTSNKTKVVPYVAVDDLGNFTGFTGLMFIPDSNNGVGFGRWYSGSGSVGNWETSASIYNNGTIYSIDIYGASYA